MKGLFKIAILLFTLTAFRINLEKLVSEKPQNNPPIVKSEARYEVQIEKDIVYAKGLSHQSINSALATEMSLKLDAYIPKNELKNRPAIVLIHGGGFAGGTKEHQHIVSMAKYFATRGWVAFSIDYRLKKHKGTIPEKWMKQAQKNFDRQKSNRFFSLYPANRDAKAAVRWLYANAEIYSINTNFITVGGGSAGAVIATTLGVSKAKDYTNEIPLAINATIATTHLDQPSKVHTILDFWGSKIAIDALQLTNKVERFDETDAPILIVHGTKDPTVNFSNAKDLKKEYTTTGVPYEFYPITNGGHGVWKATIKGKSLNKLSFDFIIKQQNLKVE